jgi:hypothetical protein
MEFICPIIQGTEGDGVDSDALRKSLPMNSYRISHFKTKLPGRGVLKLDIGHRTFGYAYWLIEYNYESDGGL